MTQKFVILVPDPIGFAPWPVLLDPGEPCDICQYTSFRPLFAGLFLSHLGTKTTWAMAFPRINCRTTSATVLTATATDTLRFVCVCASFCLSDFVETKKYWTLPKSCGSQSWECEERKKSRGKRGSLCARRRSRKTVTCLGLRVVEPVYIFLIARQTEEPEESFAAGPALQLSLFQDTSDWPPFVLLCRAACNTRPSFLIMC